MLGFVVPFKAKSKSKNWEHDCKLLGQTLKSICNQQNNNFKVFVIYTDFPENIQDNEKVILVEFPFSFVTNEELLKAELESNPGSALKNDEKMFDLGKRILFGCLQAQKYGCQFIMSIDADDLISERISGFVNENSTESIGWYVDKGYILNSGWSLILKVNKNMNYINGSTHIIHVDLLPEVDFGSKKSEEFSFFSAHGYLKERIRKSKNDTLKPLPFRALIYFVHESNWSGFAAIMKKHWIKTMIKYLLFGKLLSGSIKREFGLNL